MNKKSNILQKIINKLSKLGLTKENINNENELINICDKIGVDTFFSEYILPFVKNRPKDWTLEKWNNIKLFENTTTSMMLSLYKLNDYLINEIKDFLTYFENKIWAEIEFQIYKNYQLSSEDINFIKNGSKKEIIQNIFYGNHNSFLEPKYKEKDIDSFFP